MFAVPRDFHELPVTVRFSPWRAVDGKRWTTVQLVHAGVPVGGLDVPAGAGDPLVTAAQGQYYRGPGEAYLAIVALTFDGKDTLVRWCDGAAPGDEDLCAHRDFVVDRLAFPQLRGHAAEGGAARLLDLQEVKRVTVGTFTRYI